MFLKKLSSQKCASDYFSFPISTGLLLFVRVARPELFPKNVGAAHRQGGDTQVGHRPKQLSGSSAPRGLSTCGNPKRQLTDSNRDFRARRMKRTTRPWLRRK